MSMLEQVARALEAEVNRLREEAKIKDAEIEKRGGCIIEMSAERARLSSENKRLREGIKELRDYGDRMAKWAISEDFSRVIMHARQWIPIWDKWRILPVSPAEPEKPPLVCHEMTPEENAEAAGIIKEAWEGVPELNENEPCCTECGEDGNLSYMEQYANGEEWKCNDCGHVFIVPNQRT